MNKLEDFRAPKTLQKMALKFLVNNLTSNVEIDFKAMREAFRALDTANSGLITVEQIKKGYAHDNYITQLNNDYVEKLFQKLDSNNLGSINYSDFLAGAVDKQIALTNANLQFAFHYFDTELKGVITNQDLKEVFKRQGQTLSDEQVNEIIRQAKETPSKAQKEEAKQSQTKPDVVQ